MNIKKPNHWFAPLIIAGITIGFASAAYQFIFKDLKQAQAKKSKRQETEKAEEKSATL